MSFSNVIKSYYFFRDTVEFFTECIDAGVTGESSSYKGGYRESSNLASRLTELENRGNTVTRNYSPRDIIFGALAYVLMNPIKSKRALEYNKDNFGLSFRIDIVK